MSLHEHGMEVQVCMDTHGSVGLHGYEMGVLACTGMAWGYGSAWAWHGGRGLHGHGIGEWVCMELELGLGPWLCKVYSAWQCA